MCLVQTILFNFKCRLFCCCDVAIKVYFTLKATVHYYILTHLCCDSLSCAETLNQIKLHQTLQMIHLCDCGIAVYWSNWQRKLLCWATCCYKLFWKKCTLAPRYQTVLVSTNTRTTQYRSMLVHFYIPVSLDTGTFIKCTSISRYWYIFVYQYRSILVECVPVLFNGWLVRSCHD